MNEIKRNYYRNWYQQWQEEKRQEEKNQAMKYFSHMEDTDVSLVQEGGGQLYYRQGQLYQKGAEIPINKAGAPNYGNRQYEQGHPYHDDVPVMDQAFQSDEEAYAAYARSQRPQTSKGGLSKRQLRQLKDVGRGLLVGLPIVVILLGVMYAAGLIPEDTFSRFLGGNNPAIVAYTQAYDQLMTDHNALNQSIASHVTNRTLTPDTAALLQNDYANIRTQIETMTSEFSDLSSMNRLWSLKLQSLEQMMTALASHQQVNDEVIAVFNQFVADQNDIGTELARSLTELLTENNIRFNQLPGGGLAIQ